MRRAPFSDPFFNLKKGHDGEYSMFVVEGRVSVLGMDAPRYERFTRRRRKATSKGL